MTNFEAIGALKGAILSHVDINNRPHAELVREAFNTVTDAIIKLDQIETHGCVVCKMSKEYDCNGCAYEDVEVWKDPCRICRRNQKDYYREAEKHGNKNN